MSSRGGGGDSAEARAEASGSEVPATSEPEARLRLTRSTETIEVLVEGSRSGFAALLDWLADPVGAFACAEVVREGEFVVTAFAWQPRDTDLLDVRIHGGRLCFEGTEEARSCLRDTVALLLSDDREGIGLHIEHLPGRPVLSEGSVPLVLTVETGSR